MGTDIHPIIQVRTPEGWQYAGQGPKDDPEKPWTILGDRHYHLFSILAGVRNGVGFAGVLLAQPIVPISEPKRLPEDLGQAPPNPYYTPEDYPTSDYTPKQIEDAKRFWFGDHSHSWLTLHELESFDWSQRRTLFGVIPAEQYDAFVAQNAARTRGPKDYCGDVWAHDIETLDEANFVDQRKQGTLPPGKRIYVRVTWTETHAEICDAFCTQVLPHLRQLAQDYGVTTDDVRIVFGFHS